MPTKFKRTQEEIQNAWKDRNSYIDNKEVEENPTDAEEDVAGEASLSEDKDAKDADVADLGAKKKGEATTPIEPKEEEVKEGGEERKGVEKLTSPKKYEKTTTKMRLKPSPKQT